MKTVIEGTWEEVSKEAAGLDASSRVRLEIVSESGDANSSDAEEIRKRLESFDRLTQWIDQNIPSNLPSLSDEALSRESIYEDRGF